MTSTADVAAVTAADFTIEFCGEWYCPDPEGTFDIGRDADLSIDDNPYLHRRFLRVVYGEGLWWLVNVGNRLSATVCDAAGGAQSWLPPGARLPIVFATTVVVFSAGPTTYELILHSRTPVFDEVGPSGAVHGETTVGSVTFTLAQKQLILALAEPMLRREGSGVSEIPSSAEAARRLGWTMSQYNRKLDNVCDKLDRMGVKGMRGGPAAHATMRRARLVEYAVSSRLVTSADLALLDLPAETNEP